MSRALVAADLLVGDGTKDRFLAHWFDGFLAIAAGLVTAAAVFPREDEVERAVAIGVAFLGYFFVFEALTGTTPGKLLFGLWVRRVDGRRCAWWQAGVRTAARLVEANPLLLGSLPAAIAVLATGRHQRLGDLWAGTVVVSGDEL
jgi:uncharacterized RDD family membrane protein YckC